jgi:serine phosphatase RsbU (regulator of sigma subunit)
MPDARRVEVTTYGGVRRARALVRAAMTGRSDESIAAAELVASELVTNGLLHGGGWSSVEVRPIDGGVRIEAADRNRRTPLVAVASSDAMTGRGLHLVARLASRWGIEPSEQGKVVWAEIVDPLPARRSQSEHELLTAWADPFDTTVHPLRVRVRLGDVPTELLVAAKRHVDNLVREFTLASSGERAGTTAPVPVPLAQLIDRVIHGFEDARLEMKRQATDAARAGASHASLELELPIDAADAAAAYLQALDEVDIYSRANRLLTLETPPQHRVFRHWYIGEIVKQLRAAAAGLAQPSVTPFEQYLLGEMDAADRARRVAERAARLYTVAVALASAVTAEDVATAVLQEGVVALGASGGGVVLKTEADRLFVPGTVGYDDSVVAKLRDEDRDADLPAAYAARTGEAVWLETVEERDARFPALAGLEPGTVAMCAIPLALPGKLLGALRFSFGARQLFDDDERRFVLALAAEAAEALERASLLDRERDARRRLEHERQSLTKLAAIGEAMLRGRDLDAILELATDAATQVTGATFGAFFYNATDPDGDGYLLHTLSDRGRDDVGGLGIPRDTALFEPTFSGAGTVRIDDVSTDPRLDRNPSTPGAPDGSRPVRSYLAVPVTLSDGEVVGGLFFGHPEAGRFDETAERMAVGVAGQTAAAIENVRSLEERARVAALLQRSLLPVDLPAIEGLELGAAYSAAGAAVGGDFYDVFPLGEGRWGMAVGDVRGRGPQAAALTGLTRYTIRTASRLGLGPARVLEVLNAALLAEGEVEQFCTAVFAVLDIEGTTTRLREANGGHPPIALLHRGEPEFFAPTAGLLGVMPEAEFGERVHELEPGDALVFYTDGVSEARRDGEEFGDVRLADVLRSLASAPAQQLADDLIAAARSFGPDSANDDAAVFAVRVLGG